ncbi:MAG: hypothetical protein AAFX93_11710 [Verrucomicrobiota bacterium]
MVATAPKVSVDAAEYELALERSHQVVASRMLLLVFWGLIFAKCCILQWAIFTYDIPVDGGLFIWAPSIIFGAVCSFVYGKVTLEEFHQTPLTSRMVRGIWAACIVAMALFGIAAVGLGGMNPYLLPAIFGTLMGVGFFIQGLVDTRRYLQAAAIGWWIGSIWLFVESGPASLLSLAVLIVALQVVPTSLFYWQERKAQKQRAGVEYEI